MYYRRTTNILRTSSPPPPAPIRFPTQRTKLPSPGGRRPLGPLRRAQLHEQRLQPPPRGLVIAQTLREAGVSKELREAVPQAVSCPARAGRERGPRPAERSPAAGCWVSAAPGIVGQAQVASDDVLQQPHRRLLLLRSEGGRPVGVGSRQEAHHRVVAASDGFGAGCCRGWAGQRAPASAPCSPARPPQRSSAPRLRRCSSAPPEGKPRRTAGAAHSAAHARPGEALRAGAARRASSRRIFCTMKVATVLESSDPISMVRRQSGIISVESRKLITSVSSTCGRECLARAVGEQGGGGLQARRQKGALDRLGGEGARADLDKGADDAKRGEAQVLEGARLRDSVQERVQEQRDVGCRQRSAPISGG